MSPWSASDSRFGPLLTILAGLHSCHISYCIKSVGSSTRPEMGCLAQAVEVTDYCPAAWWVPMRLPHVIEQLLAYTFAVSAALALLNMAPVYGLDGEAALKLLFQLGEGTSYGASRIRGSLQVSCTHRVHDKAKTECWSPANERAC